MKFIPHIIPNDWAKQDDQQGFYFEAMVFENSIDMFERTQIADHTYEGVFESSKN